MQDPGSLEYQILQQGGDFPPPPEPESAYHPFDGTHANGQNNNDDHGDGEDDAEGGEEFVPPPAPAKRGGRAKAGAGAAGTGNAKEKKDKMRVQNRAAAERSRAKKRDELTSLELTVQNIQDENHRLRAQLQSLLSANHPTPPENNNNASGSTAAPDTDPQLLAQAQTPSDPLNLDYDALHALQSELSLLESKLLAATSSPSNQLLTLQQSLQTKQIQVDALRDAILHLRTTREGLHTEKEVLEREIQGRRILAKAREMVGDDERFEGLMGVPGGMGGGRAVGVERALLDLRGWLDEAVRSWNQTTTLPTRPRNGVNSNNDNLEPLALLAAASSRNGS